MVDAINQRYEFVYDALGRVTQEKKGTATKSFVYDSAGNRTQRTDYNGAVTNYSYDALDRLTTIGYPDATSATYGYDVLSRLTTATNPAGTVTIAYDNRARVASVTDTQLFWKALKGQPHENWLLWLVSLKSCPYCEARKH